MFRAAPRLIARPAARAALPRPIAPARRYISTAPSAQKSRSWKSLAARLGVAGAIIYYYNTVDVFAEEPAYTVQSISEIDSESETLPTIEAISAERQKRKAVQAQLDAQKEAQSKQQNATPATGGAEGGIEGLEEEADQQGAFNPETGEINWDCPCLGGMAHGPCGDEFKAAFSCFVFSEEEPKGMDCIDKFKDMQNCFRKYPEVYGSELEADDEDDVAEAAAASPSDLPEPAPVSTTSSDSTSTPRASIPSSTALESAPVKPPTREREAGRAEKAKQSGEPSSKPRAPEEKKSKSGTGLVPDNYKPTEREDPVSESEELVPKAAHDAQSEGTEQLERK